MKFADRILFTSKNDMLLGTRRFAIGLTLTVGAALLSPLVFANELLVKSKNCVACHSVSSKIIGPSYKDIAKKYAGDDSAAVKLSNKIRLGGSGAWGSIPMPPNAQVSEAEALTLAKWILGQK